MSAEIIETKDLQKNNAPATDGDVTKDSVQTDQKKKEPTGADNVIELEHPAVQANEGKQDTGSEKMPELPEIKSVPHAKAILESLLFATNDSLSVSKLSALLGDMETKIIRQLLLELQVEYDNSGRGIMIQEVAGGYIMATRKSNAPWVTQLFRFRQRNPLTPAMLETLAIIAYKQPLTRADVDAIRGVDSSAMVRQLHDLSLVEVVGKKEIIGRPQLYGTTKQFLKSFGLKSLSNLPTISELKKV